MIFFPESDFRVFFSHFHLFLPVLVFSKLSILVHLLEIVRIYGSDGNKKSLQKHSTRNIVPNVRSLKEAADSGIDPKTVVLVESVRSNESRGKRQTLHYLLHYTLHYFLLS